jgi:pimeloyl-ACP methyl ester carboxylesterase
MSYEWEIVESGPKSADHTVLLIPGGLNTSRSYAELMAQPALSGVRMIAVTLPGHGGTPPPEDFSIENYARLLLTSPPASVVMLCSGSASAQASRSRWLRQERSPGRLSC